jgi:hypothetical protein
MNLVLASKYSASFGGKSIATAEARAPEAEPEHVGAAARSIALPRSFASTSSQVIA